MINNMVPPSSPEPPPSKGEVGCFASLIVLAVGLTLVLFVSVVALAMWAVWMLEQVGVL